MGRTGEAPLFALNFFQRRLQVIDSAMEIIGRAEKDNGASNPFQVDIISQGGGEKRVLIVTIADTSARRSRRLDAFVRTNGQYGELAPHGVTIDPSFRNPPPAAVPKRSGHVERPRRKGTNCCCEAMALRPRSRIQQQFSGIGFPVPGWSMVTIQGLPNRWSAYSSDHPWPRQRTASRLWDPPGNPAH